MRWYWLPVFVGCGITTLVLVDRGDARNAAVFAWSAGIGFCGTVEALTSKRRS